MAYYVEVEWMDGSIKVYPKVVTKEEEGQMTVFVEKDGKPVVFSIIPLNNVREVRYP